MNTNPNEKSKDSLGTISKEDAQIVIAAYNSDSVSKHLLPDTPHDFISGYSFGIQEIKALVDYLENHPEIPDNQKRVFFGYGFHHAGIAGANHHGHTLLAAPMVFGQYAPDAEAGWFIPKDAELYNYCQPCPTICPKVNLTEEDEWTTFKEV
jgi:hypothetical protein